MIIDYNYNSKLINKLFFKSVKQVDMTVMHIIY
jgi:hypothetical protein